MKIKLIRTIAVSIVSAIVIYVMLRDMKTGFDSLHQSWPKLLMSRTELHGDSLPRGLGRHHFESYENSFGDTLTLIPGDSSTYLVMSFSTARIGGIHHLLWLDISPRRYESVPYFQQRLTSWTPVGEVAFQYGNSSAFLRSDSLFFSFNRGTQHEVDTFKHFASFRNCSEIIFSPNGIHETHSLSSPVPLNGAIHLDEMAGRVILNVRASAR